MSPVSPFWLYTFFFIATSDAVCLDSICHVLSIVDCAPTSSRGAGLNCILAHFFACALLPRLILRSQGLLFPSPLALNVTRQTAVTSGLLWPAACADGIRVDTGDVAISMWVFIDPGIWSDILPPFGNVGQTGRGIFSLQPAACSAASVPFSYPKYNLFARGQQSMSLQTSAYWSTATGVPNDGKYVVNSYASMSFFGLPRDDGFDTGAYRYAFTDAYTTAPYVGKWSHVVVTLSRDEGLTGVFANGLGVLHGVVPNTNSRWSKNASMLSPGVMSLLVGNSVATASPANPWGQYSGGNVAYTSFEGAAPAPCLNRETLLQSVLF